MENIDTDIKLKGLKGKIHFLLQGLRVKTCNVDSKVDLVHSNFL